jgi:hypothetical protein
MDAGLTDLDRRADRAGAGLVQEHDGFWPAQDLAPIYAILKRVEIPSSLFYLSRSALQTPQTTSLLGEYLPDALVAFVVAHLRRVLRAAPADVQRRCHGFELWTTRARRSETGQIYLHIDCDEKLRTTTGTVRTPMLGSVMYIGPRSGLIGGETLFVIDDRADGRFTPYKFHDWKALAGADAVRVVKHDTGKLALFAGHLRHGQGPVIDHSEGEPRVAFLANLWDARIGDVPQGICTRSPEEFRRRAQPQN